MQQYYDAPPSARTMWASAPRVAQVGTVVQRPESDRKEVSPSIVTRPAELIGTNFGIEHRTLSNNPSTKTLHEQLTLSKDPSAQTIVDYRSLSKASPPKTLFANSASPSPASWLGQSQTFFTKASFQLPLPVAPGAVEEAMSQASTARVSTVINHGTRIPPKVPYVPTRYQRNGSNPPPVRSSSFSPAPRSRNTWIADSKNRVCTAHDVDENLGKIDAWDNKIKAKYCKDCGKFILDSTDKKQEIVTHEKKEKALCNLRMQPANIDAAHLAIREAVQAGVCEKDLERYRSKLDEMEREEKLEKARGDERMRKAQDELFAMKSQLEAAKKEHSDLKISKSELEQTKRKVNQRFALAEKALEEDQGALNSLQKQQVEHEADNDALQMQVDEMKRHTDCKVAELEKENRILREREKENISSEEHARLQKESVQQKMNEKRQDAKLISDLQKQLQDSEAAHQESSVAIARLDMKLKAVGPSYSRSMPFPEAEAYREDLKSRVCELEKTHEMHKAQHHLLWSFISKDSEPALKQQLLELRDRCP